jgi:lipopolysaccharide/colanic/teichoic acid biosynthesis glycosyltransferase
MRVSSSASVAVRLFLATERFTAVPFPRSNESYFPTLLSLSVLPSSDKLIAEDRFGEARLRLAEAGRDFVSANAFAKLLALERRRAERAQKQLLLMLVDASELSSENSAQEVIRRILRAVASSIRETDITGWYEERLVAGAILTEIPPANLSIAVNSVSIKVNAALLRALSPGQVNRLRFSFHVFPESSSTGASGHTPPDLKLYPDVLGREASERLSRLIKRSIDLAGSLLLLALASPLMAAIAAAIKLTSRGPVLFRQERLGQYGRPFTLLKFRSMVENTDPAIHREYVKQYISGRADGNQAETSGRAVYKLTDDPRVTPIGRFLRKASLDELPQFFNVLAGQMSLVGPRPPIPYECAAYEPWHRRRLLEAKPGITGLWQVSGRSRTKFDDMVRLDLRYVRSRSLLLDLRILLQTPRAVFSREGAY